MNNSFLMRVLLIMGLGMGLVGCFNSSPQHGTALLIGVDTARFQTEGDRQQIRRATLDALRKRVERFGARFSIQPAGTNEILLKVETLQQKDLAALHHMLLPGGLLEFCLVYQAGSPLPSGGASGPESARLSLERKLPDGRTVQERYTIKRPPEMIGCVKSATVVRDNLGRPEIDFTFTPEGAARFAQVTRENIGRQLAIVLDGKLLTAPVIRSAIESDNGVIQGDYDIHEAIWMAAVFESPLPAPLAIMKEEAF